MISMAPNILLMTAATAPVHVSSVSSGSGGAVLGAAIFQIVGMCGVIAYMFWRTEKDKFEEKERREKPHEPYTDEVVERMKREQAEVEVLRPWMKEPRMRFDDYQKTLAQQAKWEAEEQEAKNHEHDTPSK